MTEEMADLEIKGAVRERYGAIASEFAQKPGTLASCCGPSKAAPASCCGPSTAALASCCDPRTAAKDASTAAATLYPAEDLAGLPQDLSASSLGCGNPLALAELQPGEAVLDLGSGAGLDCFLAAQRVGPDGHVIGLDMTPEMIFLARRNAAKIGAANVEFRLGEMEQIPVPDASVDAVISNCVVNLSPDKGQVFREVYRVLRPGGRLSISDIVLDGGLPAPIRASMSTWVGCIAGALEEADYLGQIQAAGFAEITVQSRDYVGFSEAGDQDEGWSYVAALLDEAGLPRNAMDHKVASVRVRATKPG